ncbi:hypothetical protein GLX27_003218 [Malassezia furfur]|uniref:Secreted protein n=1 Tax=Malassezia furfur TaxID=55194 RepID=A0ABY8ESK9_MALFU|nr:hypothetical protein GLX27_003218 [Malassezia furfur]
MGRHRGLAALLVVVHLRRTTQLCALLVLGGADRRDARLVDLVAPRDRLGTRRLLVERMVLVRHADEARALALRGAPLGLHLLVEIARVVVQHIAAACRKEEVVGVPLEGQEQHAHLGDRRADVRRQIRLEKRHKHPRHEVCTAARRLGRVRVLAQAECGGLGGGVRRRVVGDDRLDHVGAHLVRRRERQVGTRTKAANGDQVPVKAIRERLHPHKAVLHVARRERVWVLGRLAVVGVDHHTVELRRDQVAEVARVAIEGRHRCGQSNHIPNPPPCTLMCTACGPGGRFTGVYT